MDEELVATLDIVVAIVEGLEVVADVNVVVELVVEEVRLELVMVVRLVTMLIVGGFESTVVFVAEPKLPWVCPTNRAMAPIIALRAITIIAAVASTFAMWLGFGSDLTSKLVRWCIKRLNMEIGVA